MKTLKNFILLAALVTFSLATSAQLRFIVQNGDTAKVFGTFTTALAATQQGDTLYLPGGIFDIGNIIIGKKLTMIGAGHYPAYSEATGRTELSGNINLVAGADSSQFHGFYLTGNISWGTNSSNLTVNKITINRCNVNHIKLRYSAYTSTSEQILITENVVRTTIDGGNAQNILIEKNIVNDIENFNNNTLITNNVVLEPSSYLFDNIISCTIQNNIFVYTGNYLFYNCSANTIKNNLFVNTYSGGTNNIDKQPLESIFVNYTGGAFSYDFDFHLQETSPGKNAGTDGMDIGIYGTDTPYKEGVVPFNPHITIENIATKTDTQGKLEVKVTVEAQNQ